MLLLHGANPSIKDNQGKPAYFYAHGDDLFELLSVPGIQVISFITP
jgi:hypothetical protein